jgi:hypothetical protein
MTGDGESTVVELLSELGLGMHERIFPSFRMNVPLDELARSAERVPHMIVPLTVVAKKAGRLVLKVEGEGAAAMSEAPVSIADDSLYVSGEAAHAAKVPGPPPLPDEGAPKAAVLARVALTKVRVTRGWSERPSSAAKAPVRTAKTSARPPKHATPPSAPPSKARPSERPARGKSLAPRKSASLAPKSAAPARKSLTPARKSAAPARKAAETAGKSEAPGRKSMSPGRKSVTPGRKSSKSIAVPKKSVSPGRKSIAAPKKSAAPPRKSIRPCKQATEEEGIDAGWDDVE